MMTTVSYIKTSKNLIERKCYLKATTEKVMMMDLADIKKKKEK